MKVEELNDLKYRELQKLAKDHGVKANLPKAGLITALVEVFQKNMDTTDPNSIIETHQEENISEPIAQLSPEKEEIVTQNVPIFEPETKSETIQEEEIHSLMIEPSSEKIGDSSDSVRISLDSGRGSTNIGSDVEVESEIENDSDQEEGPNLPTASLDDSTSIIYEPRIIGSLKSYLPPDSSKDLGDVASIMKNHTDYTYYNYSVYYKASCYGVSPYAMYYARYCSDKEECRQLIQNWNQILNVL